MSGPLRVRGGVVVTPDALLTDHEVVAEDGVIVAIRPAGAGDAAPVVSAPVVLPGLVDLHAHGACGSTFSSGERHDWDVVLAAHRAHGTTTIVPTLATDRVPALLAALGVADEVAASTTAGAAMVAGVHLEGPFLAPARRGAHPVDALQAPDGETWAALEPFWPLIGLLTIAPELPGATELVRRCVAAGIVVSIGHSDATPAQLRDAVDLGLSHVAHLWSGQSSLTHDGPWRRPGLVEEVLASDGLTAELIADGVHVPAPLARMAHRCLGSRRLALVSDASAGAGLDVGARFEMGAVSGVVADRVALTPDGGAFCGSTGFLVDMLRFVVAEAGIGLVDATRMAATTPADIVGLATRGRLEVGARADVVLATADLVVTGVVGAAESAA